MYFYLTKTQTNMQQQKAFLSLGWQDVLKAIIVAVLFSVLTTLSPIISSHRFPTGEEWQNMGFDGINIAIAYLLKNLLTNSDGKFLKAEPKTT